MRFVLGTAVLLLVASVAAPVLAQSDERASEDENVVSDRPAEAELERLKQAAVAEVDRRLAVLEGLRDAVNSAERLVPGHRVTLTAQVVETAASLEERRAAVLNAATLRELRALIAPIVTDHWVFALAVPKVHEVIAADSLVAVGEDLSAVHERIAAAIDRAIVAGLDVTEARAALRRARTTVGEALALASDVPDRVLPITARQMPDSSATLLASAQSLGRAFEHLNESAAATRLALAELRAAVDQAET